MKSPFKARQKYRTLRAQRLNLPFVPSYVPKYFVDISSPKNERKNLWASSEQELLVILHNIIMSNNQLTAIYDLDVGDKKDWRQPLQKKMLLTFQSI